MRQLLMVSFCAAFLGLVLMPTAQAQWSEKRLQNLYVDFLKGQGMTPTVDEDGDVQFKYEDRTYFIEVNENDNEFFRVVLFNIWPVESSAEAVEVAFACNEVNRQMKVTKAYITNDNVWVACEIFVGNPADFEEVFSRCLEVINDGVDIFVENM